ncbi:hypothetical protein I6A60_08550 [Frankia sp. AgB1.9]|uniref:hypothetical protein n=1 Tax=unclassified Frankia TaxID=2632575 RepID=UPI001932B29A|nr:MULTISPECIES: hypothetical protein [unclassified Frankia]MBL7547921.1 hypothetical protein [Frankia sp. AgB1.9]MBL7623954.1 hypothetical protein [Frankia sp. AgB1.8]
MLMLSGVLALVLFVLARTRDLWRRIDAYAARFIDVQELVDATRQASVDLSLKDLTARFRKHLSECSVELPATLPAVPPATQFLDLLGDVDLSPKELGKSIPRLLGRLRQKLSYRISGVLLYREELAEPYGITVTITSFAPSGTRMATHWGRSWDEVIQRAGYWVVGALLPITKRGKQAPWRDWRYRDFPPELFAAYQEAQSAYREQQFELALGRYYKALSYDPKNIHLRALVGAVRERLKQNLHALDIYQRTLTVQAATKNYDERLWFSPWSHWCRLRGRLACLFHPRAYADLVGVRYRNAIVLATSEITVKQWCKPDDDTARGQDREKIRESLQPMLVSRYWPVAVDFALGGLDQNARDRAERDGEVEQLTKEWFETKLERRTEPSLLRVLFQRAGLQEMELLRRDNGFVPRVVRWIFCGPLTLSGAVGAGSGLTRPAIRINQVWAPLRWAWAKKAYETAGGNLPPRGAGQERRTRPKHFFERMEEKVPFETAPEKLVQKMARWWGRRTGRQCSARWGWQEHYNAACVLAVAMNYYTLPFVDSDATKKLDKLAGLAIAHLERAVQGDDQISTGVEMAWMISEDSDLDRLRDNEQFARFERRIYLYTWNQNPFDRQMKYYEERLLGETADLMARHWRERGARATVEAAEVHRWVRSEKDAWEHLYHFAADGKHYVPDRLKLIHSGTDVLSTRDSRYPPRLFETRESEDLAELTSGDLAARYRRCADGADWIDENLQVVANCVGEDSTRSPIRRTRDWVTALENDQRAGLRTLTPDKHAEIQRLCFRLAAAWGDLAAWPTVSRGERRFRKSLRLVPKPSSRWRT